MLKAREIKMNFPFRNGFFKTVSVSFRVAERLLVFVSVSLCVAERL